MEDIENFAFRSISPAIRGHLSPIRVSSRLTNYEKTKKKIASINKSLFNSEIDTQPILRLEKAALRGAGVEKSTKNKLKKVTQPKSPLEQTLHKEHKVKSEGTQIVKLPKLPYGHHQPYNEESEDFYGSHFISAESKPEIVEELRNLTRKFKLNERIKSKKYHKKSNSENTSKNELCVYKMESGELHANKNNNILESYEGDKSKYVVKHHYVYQTFRKVGTKANNDLDIGVYDETFNEKDPVDEKMKIKRKLVDVDGLIKRLYLAPETKKTELSRKLVHRYSRLFDDASYINDKSYQLFDSTYK